MSESTTFFGWRQLLSSDSSNGVLAAFQFLTASGAIGISILGRKDFPAVAIFGLLCGILALISASVSGVHLLHPLFESRRMLSAFSWLMVLLWLVGVALWAGMAAHRVKETSWGWTLGDLYIANLCLALVSAFINTFIHRYQKSLGSELV